MRPSYPNSTQCLTANPAATLLKKGASPQPAWSSGAPSGWSGPTHSRARFAALTNGGSRYVIVVVDKENNDPDTLSCYSLQGQQITSHHLRNLGRSLSLGLLRLSDGHNEEEEEGKNNESVVQQKHSGNNKQQIVVDNSLTVVRDSNAKDSNKEESANKIKRRVGNSTGKKDAQNGLQQTLRWASISRTRS